MASVGVLLHSAHGLQGRVACRMIELLLLLLHLQLLGRHPSLLLNPVGSHCNTQRITKSHGLSSSFLGSGLTCRDFLLHNPQRLESDIRAVVAFAAAVVAAAEAAVHPPYGADCCS